MKSALGVRWIVVALALVALWSSAVEAAKPGATMPTGDPAPVVDSTPMLASPDMPIQDNLGPPGSSSASDSMATQPPAPDAETAGTVGELTQRLHDGNLVEWRTTYNGSYGASLLFYPPDVVYYVTLFRDRHFWRVIKTTDEHRAEMIYRIWSKQTATLAAVELQRARLEAQRTFIEQMIALSKERAKWLQADLDVARTEQARVQAWQERVQAQAVALSTENDRSRRELQQLQDQVQKLQTQIDNAVGP